MKTKVFTSILLMMITSALFVSNDAMAQCTPLDETECPDPEDNGQVCPDTMPAATINQFYSEVITIKPPGFIDSLGITIHSIQLMDIGNLPEGLSWVSNSPDSVFLAGEYYCVLLDGTPTIPGTYYLKIIVDVYVELFPGWDPVLVGTMTDSTSAFIDVQDPFSIAETKRPAFDVKQNRPNPFSSETMIEFYSADAGTGSLGVYSILGKEVYKESIRIQSGENQLVFNAGKLEDGVYFYILSLENHRVSRSMLIKH